MNNEAVKPAPEQEPLMAIVDDISAEYEESGWWKHDGHSIVSYASSEDEQNIMNVNESNEGFEGEDGSDKDGDSKKGSEDEEETDEDTGDNNQEIPEFSAILLPFIIVLCIAMFSRK